MREPEHKKHFKDIDFEKEWSEDDWRRFFQAQDELLREIERDARTSPFRRRGRASVDELYRRLGLDSEDGILVPNDLNITDEALENGSLIQDTRLLPEEGSPAEQLPLHQLALSFAQKVLWLSEYRYHAFVRKEYKSARHAATQKHFLLLQEHVVKIPKFVALGHELGYRGDRVNGNIVRCLTALEHADACLGHASRLGSGILRAGDAASLFRWAFRARNTLIAWIYRLRREAH